MKIQDKLNVYFKSLQYTNQNCIVEELEEESPLKLPKELRC